MANNTAFLALCIVFLFGGTESESNVIEALLQCTDSCRDNGTQKHIGDDALHTTGLFTSTGNISTGNTDLLMPEWVYWSASAFLLLISAIGLLMNIVVVIIILDDPKKMTPLNWMLLNLAFSDGAIAGFGTTISAVAASQFTWPFSDELCVAYAMIMSTAGIGSITTLTILALWRCQHVIGYSAKRNGPTCIDHNGRLGYHQGALLLAFIWAYTLAVTCPPLFGWGRYDREAAHISCSVNWESKMDNNRSYIFYMFTLGMIVPLMAIVISYVSILFFVHKTSKMRRKLKAAIQSNAIEQRIDNGGNNRVEKKVTVMVAIMISAFLAAWTPYSIMALVETFISDAGHSDDFLNTSIVNRSGYFFKNGTVSPALATIPSLFAKMSAVVNPLIYGLLNTQFRSAWKKLTSRFVCRRKHRQTRRRCHDLSGRNNYLQTLFDCAGGSKPLAIIQPCSTREIVSSYSQRASARVERDASTTHIPPVPPNTLHDDMQG